MKKLYHRLLLLTAGATQKQLASPVRYLKIENEILRSKLPRRFLGYRTGAMKATDVLIAHGELLSYSLACLGHALILHLRY